jgi:hypothetical protein
LYLEDLLKEIKSFIFCYWNEAKIIWYLHLIALNNLTLSAKIV